ncbi:MAG: DUF3500 domain-containing protein [Pirellulaceae bacterium]
MKRRLFVLAALLGVVFVAAGFAFLQKRSSGDALTSAAGAYLSTLSEKQRAQSQLPYDTEQRVGWHFIPKDERKGLQIKHMDEKQRKAAHKLLSSAMSKIGYEKTTTIMQLEQLLHILEEGKGRNIRDPERYYFTVFGEPKETGRWGLSVEGHHLSLNFVVEDGEMISSTPTFFGANPATVMSDVPGGDVAKGTRVLADEEQLAFDLLHALDEGQRKQAVIDEKAPAEIRAAGEAQPPVEEPVGIAAAQLKKPQMAILRKLIAAYAGNVPADEAQERLAAIKEAGADKIHFAWAGADKPGIGHYYRVQGPTFLIEFVNTQPDAAGNPANHIHCVWRDTSGDFARPLAAK